MVLEETLLLDRKPWFEIYQQKVLLPDGRIIDDYHRFRSFVFAVIVAVTTKGDFVLIRQYRHGPGKVTWALPGGAIEPDEPAAQAATRELFEETGYRAKSWIDLGLYTGLANYGGSDAHFFLALDAERHSEPIEPDLEGGTIHELSRETVEQLLDERGLDIQAVVVGLALALRKTAK